MSTDDAETDKQLVVDNSCNIQKGSNNALDLPNMFDVEGRAVFVFGGILCLFAVNNGAVLMRG